MMSVSPQLICDSQEVCVVHLAAHVSFASGADAEHVVVAGLWEQAPEAAFVPGPAGQGRGPLSLGPHSLADAAARAAPAVVHVGVERTGAGAGSVSALNRTGTPGPHTP